MIETEELRDPVSIRSINDVVAAIVCRRAGLKASPDNSSHRNEAPLMPTDPNGSLARVIIYIPYAGAEPCKGERPPPGGPSEGVAL